MLLLREITRWDTSRSLFACTLLALIASGAMFAQQDAPAKDGKLPLRPGAGCWTPDAPEPGVATFEDKLSGFRFNYPASLDLTEGALIEIASVPCGSPPHNVLITIQVDIASKRPWNSPSGSVQKKAINGIEWEEDLSRGRAVSCTFAHEEYVCLDGKATPGKDSTEYLDALRMIESSFVFTEPAERMDAQIAAMKIGEHFGDLTVKRVVTRTMALREPKRDSQVLIGFGEIDFSGELLVSGSIDNARTMNSGDDWIFSPDFDQGSPFPFHVDKTIDRGIEFRNANFFAGELKRLSFPDDVKAKMKNISVVFGPLGGISIVRADLVGLTAR